MSTGSTIGLLQPNGSVKAIYVQYDGHPDRQGLVLRINYGSTEDVEKLMALGDLLHVGAELGDQQDVNKPTPESCLAFARDGREELSSATIFEDLEKWLVDFNGCEFAYLFDGQEWEFYRHVLTTRLLKPGVEILSYWEDFYDIRVTSIYDYLAGQKKSEVARQLADQE